MFKSTVLLIIIATCRVYCNVTSICSQKEICSTYLDIAMDMISKAKCSIPTCNNSPKIEILKAMDCADVFSKGRNKSGVYEIWPVNRVIEGKSLYVYCDMDTDGGGWTVIQRRGDFQNPKDFFYQTWESYKEGFGNITKEFWLGNDNIYALSNQKLYSVRFDLKDVEQNHKYALYEKFWIDDEINKYRLHISIYSGDAGDSMISHHNSQSFSTKDRDNDNNKDKNCAVTYKGGWWYNSCHFVNLNGLYHKGKHGSDADGVNWYLFKGHKESLEWTEIKIRPKHFKTAFAPQVTPL